jgi:hypothetical protein
MDDTMALIQQSANERHNLYRLAAKGHLMPDQQYRLRELNDRIPLLWDQYRREYASRRSRPIKADPFEIMRAA